MRRCPSHAVSVRLGMGRAASVRLGMGRDMPTSALMY
jgi:hypothetical protein